VERTPRAGEFVWVDLMTPDMAASEEFYGRIFGWSLDQQETGPNGYRHFRNDDAAFGGALPWGMKSGPAQWLPYMLVEDVDHASRSAVDLGATLVMPPCEIPRAGAFSVIVDPQRASLTLFRANQNIGLRASQDEVPPGGIAMYELVTTEPVDAVAFYAGFAGWLMEETESDGSTYWTAELDGKPVASIRQKPERITSPQWIVSFRVQDCKATTRLVEDLGGSVLIAPYAEPGLGTRAWFVDPAGASFAVIES
jgi:uncharacterized protein